MEIGPRGTPGRNVEDFLFREDLAEADPDTDLLIRGEDDRQTEKLILIASESIAPRAVRQALTSSFTNLYAEGYPSLRMCRDERDAVMDVRRHLSFFRRYSDRRFYKGTEYADLIETLAQKRAADVFATGAVRPADLQVNVQALSGAAANNAVYEALVPPGECVMGMALPHGGHLTHGSPWNRSGKHYRIVPYEVDPETGRLDYDRIEALASEHRPRMLIAGASAYPWDLDWARLRAVADGVPGGCVLLADIAHPAGLVAAGLFPSPVGHAHVVTMTTHKTLCGPRAAVILTTDPAHGRAINRAIFPGEQGGPHVNAIAAVAVSLLIARTEKFRRLQARILENSKALAAGLAKRGLRLAYGGTASHLCLVDLNALAPESGVPLKGDVATNILDLAGIVTNRNTIPGDQTAADSSAVRFGTTFLTQRGLGPAEMDTIAGLVHRALAGIRTFRIQARGGPRTRGRVDLELLEGIRREVATLARGFAGESAKPDLSDPHLYPPAGPPSGGPPSGPGASAWLEVSGERAEAFLQGVLSVNVATLAPGEGRGAWVVGRDGEVVDDVGVFCIGRDARGRARFLLRSNPENRARLALWLRALSDGFVRFDPDLTRKIEGPVVVEDLGKTSLPGTRRTAFALVGPKAPAALKAVAPGLASLASGRCAEGEVAGARVLVARLDAGTAPWIEVLCRPEDAPKLATRLEANDGDAAGRAARGSAGLPDYGRARPAAAEALRRGPEGRADLAKPYFIGQAGLVAALGGPPAKPEFSDWPKPGPLKRTPLYEEHARLTKKANIVPFAGWEMPVLYGSIFDEHAAVRAGAGLFDVAHMGVLEVAGPRAERFLDHVTTNYVAKLRPGQSHYSYVLDPDGTPLDDILVYRRGPEKFLLVVNASNAERVLAWFRAVASRKFLIDRAVPGRELEAVPEIRDLKDPACGADRRVDLALQGPRSLEILQVAAAGGLQVAAAGGRLAGEIAALRRFHFLECEVRGIPLVVSRSGYTGEEWGFELLVPPDRALDLWKLLREIGDGFGLKPCGLGARDSTRTEAGFPLYGHELAGDHDISPLAAGYGAFVKWHKPFFVGRDALKAKEDARTGEIVRFEVPGGGDRGVRPGDTVANRRGQKIGLVTSCAFANGAQIGLAFVDRRFASEGTKLAVFASRDGRKDDRLAVPEEARVVSRFPLRGAKARAAAAKA
ncbi:MAG: glycine cleavage system aminomethyltransferase GcvT [Planctomycetales bacterium]|nr:glycine cleavage system aminomethyltransferase GcvT [Planctomycetales bacterium]